MENIFDIPRTITGLDAIPVPTTTHNSTQIIDSSASENTDANSLTTAQALSIEKNITRGKDELGTILTSSGEENELWSYDDFDNAYNKGISIQEKQAYTFWIENKTGRKQTGFFARYSLDRTAKDIVDFKDLSGKGVANSVISWMKLGVIFFDFEENSFVPLYIFTTGNLYQKQKQIADKKIKITEMYGSDAYTQHYQAIQNAYAKVYDNRIKISGVDLDKCLQIDINSDISKETMVSEIVFDNGKTQRGNFKVFENSKGAKNFLNGKGAGKQSKGKGETSFKELSVREAFMFWLRHAVEDYNDGTGVNLFGTDWRTIYNQFMLRNNVNLGQYDEAEKFMVRERAVRIGKTLFSDFLQRGLPSTAKVNIEFKWNEKYNHYPNTWDESLCQWVGGRENKTEYKFKNGSGKVNMVSGKVPIGFSMAKRYGGNPNAPIVDIRPEKRRALSYNTISQFQTLLAYGVGLGKTWCAIFQVAQALEIGICKRPLFILPNQVYPQFVKEIKSILPQIKVNELYNLRGELRDGISDIKDNSISVITETGLEILGFTQEYVDEGFTETAMSTLQEMNTQKLSQKEADKVGNTYREFNNPLTKSGLEKVYIDKLKFDFLIVDEAHNYKNLITSVSGKVIDEALEEEKSFEQKVKREKTNFGFGSGSPSARAIRLFFLTDYVQQFHPFGNTLLLTATPFTNSPLEVWSMLTYVDRTMLNKTGLNASLDFFKIFGDMGFNTEAKITGQIVEKYTFLGWKNLPALQNLLFSHIDYISPDDVDLKRPNKIVFPLKSITNGETNAVRVLEQKEQLSAIITMTPLQVQLVDELKDYASGTLDWMPKLYEKRKEGKDGNQVMMYYPLLQEEVDEACASEVFIGCEQKWNTTNLVSDGSKLKWLVGTHKPKGKKAEVELIGNDRQEDGELAYGSGSKLDGDVLSDIGSFSDGSSTAMLRSLTYQRQITISPFLYTASGHKENPTPKQYIESSAKLSYVMGCIESVKKHHESTETEMSGQIIYMDIGVSAFPLIAEYLIEELDFSRDEIGIICGQKNLTRVMSSVNKKGKPKPMAKQEVQNAFNGVEQLPNGDFEPVSDDKRVKVLIGSSTISEGMNLQFKSSVIYQCYLDFNPTAQTQLEGRMWRQGNPFKFVRIVNPLCADSIDIFMFQKMQDKTKYINQIWNRDGQTFMMDVREFDAMELKEACITNPMQLAMFQVDEIKKDIQRDMQEIMYEKSKYDNVKNLLDKKVVLTFGEFPSDTQTEDGRGITLSAFSNGDNSVYLRLYTFIKSVRPDLIDKDVFSNSYYRYLLNQKKTDEVDKFEASRIVREAYIGENDLNYTLVELLEIVRQVLKEKKFTLPMGFSKEANKPAKKGDKVTFMKRGETFEGVVRVEFPKEDDFDYEVEYEVDGEKRTAEVRVENEGVKRIVEVVEGEEENRMLGWGSKEFVEIIPHLYTYQLATSDYDSFSRIKYIISNTNPDIDDSDLALEINSLSVMSSVVPLQLLLGIPRWHLNEDNSEENWGRRSEVYKKPNYILQRFMQEYLKKSVYTSNGSDSEITYEPSYMREIKYAENTFERTLKSEGVVTLSQLVMKIKGYDEQIQTLKYDMDNVGNSEKVRERAIEIQRKRDEEAKNKDNALKEGDWKKRVKDFASLNCLLDLMQEKEVSKIEVRKKKAPALTDRRAELQFIEKRIMTLKLLVKSNPKNEFAKKNIMTLKLALKHHK
jgi:hypothetical protein